MSDSDTPRDDAATVIDIRTGYVEPELPPRPNPAVWGRWLGRQLVELRMAAGITQAAARKAIDDYGKATTGKSTCSVGRMTYLEKGERPPTGEELSEVILPLYGVPEARWSLYTTAALQAGGKGWWDNWPSGDITPTFGRYVGFEDGAQLVRAYHPLLVHGLAQSEEYAKTLHRKKRPISEQRVERLVRLRMTRQKALLKADDPLSLHVVLDEAALWRVVGSKEIMAAQLDHLIELGARDNVTVQVIAFEAGDYIGANGAYAMLDFGMESDPGVVHLERGLLGDQLLDTIDVTDEHAAAFEEVSGLALDHNESLKLIRSKRQDYARG